MRDKFGRFIKGYHPPTEFKKGHTSWLKGKKGIKMPWVSKSNKSRIGPKHPHESQHQIFHSINR